MADTATLACTYAALILHDEGIDINSNKIAAIVKAAGVNIEAFWPKLIAESLKGRSISDFFGVGGGSAAPAATPAAAPAAAEKKDDKKKVEEKPKKEEKPKVEEDEFDGGMGDLFG